MKLKLFQRQSATNTKRNNSVYQLLSNSMGILAGIIYSRRHKNGDISVPSKWNARFAVCRSTISTLPV